VDLAVLRDGALLLRRVLGAVGADDGDRRLALGGEAGAGEADALLLISDVLLGHLGGLDDGLGLAVGRSVGLLTRRLRGVGGVLGRVHRGGTAGDRKSVV